MTLDEIVRSLADIGNADEAEFDRLWPMLGHIVYAVARHDAARKREPDRVRILIEACTRADMAGSLPDEPSAALALVHGLDPVRGTLADSLLRADSPGSSS